MDRAKEALAQVNPNGIEFAVNPYQAAKGADAVLILTEWEEFATLNLEELRKAARYPIVLDGRNLYDPATMIEHGFSYYSVGRPPAIRKEAQMARAAKRELA